MELLFLIGAVIAIIISENSKTNKITNSKDYRDWYEYYFKSGYSDKQATQFAIDQCKRGDKLEYYNLDPANIQANVTPTMGASEPKKKDPYASINWILAVACFCVIAGLLAMIGSINDSLVAPLFVVITLGLFASGYGLKACTKVLQPVGKAFLASSLVLMTFFFIPFNDIFASDNTATLAYALACMIFYALGALILNNRYAGTFVYFWAMLFIWSIFLLLKLPISALPYIIVTPITIVCYIASYLYLAKVEWLPVCFRAGARIMHIVLLPLLFFIEFILMLIPYFGQSYTLFRTIMMLLLVGLYAWKYFNDKSTRGSIFLRFLCQSLLLVFVADLLNFSFFESRHYNSIKVLSFSAIWAVSFFAQAVTSLYVKHKDVASEECETKAGIFALAGLASTLLVATGLRNAEYGTIACVVLGLLAILGVFFATRKKNLNWLYASYVALLILEFILNNVVFKYSWTDLYGFIYFALLSLAGILIYPLLSNYDKDKSLQLSSTMAVSSSLFAAFTGMGYFDYASLALLAPTIVVWILAAMGRKLKTLFEVAIYATSITLLVLVYDIASPLIGSCASQHCANTVLDIQKFIQINIFAVALAITSWLFDNWKEKSANAQPRLILGYSAFTFVGTLVALFARGDQGNMGIGLIFLLEQAIILTFASLIQKRWLAIASGVVLALGGFYMTGLYKYSFIWLIMLGLGLIGLVIWRLVALNNSNGGDKKE